MTTPDTDTAKLAREIEQALWSEEIERGLWNEGWYGIRDRMVALIQPILDRFMREQADMKDAARAAALQAAADLLAQSQHRAQELKELLEFSGAEADRLARKVICDYHMQDKGEPGQPCGECLTCTQHRAQEAEAERDRLRAAEALAWKCRDLGWEQTEYIIEERDTARAEAQALRERLAEAERLLDRFLSYEPRYPLKYEARAFLAAPSQVAQARPPVEPKVCRHGTPVWCEQCQSAAPEPEPPVVADVCPHGFPFMSHSCGKCEPEPPAEVRGETHAFVPCNREPPRYDCEIGNRFRCHKIGCQKTQADPVHSEVREPLK